jgi:hypothetical protein
MKRRITEALALVILLGCAQAWADPIDTRQILGGEFDTNTLTGHFSVFGPGFSLNGDVDVSLLGCVPCRAGDPVQELLLGEVRKMSGTIDGVTYPQLFVGNDVFGSPSSFSVEGSFTVPADAMTGTQLSFPFTTLDGDFHDRLVGYASPVISDSTTPVFDFNVWGSGTATTTLTESQNPPGPPIFEPGAIKWTFDSPSPTPEPASLLLVGTGLGVIVARRWRIGRERRGSRTS